MLDHQRLFNLVLRQAMEMAQSLLNLAAWIGKCRISAPCAGGKGTSP